MLVRETSIFDQFIHSSQSQSIILERESEGGREGERERVRKRKRERLKEREN